MRRTRREGADREGRAGACIVVPSSRPAGVAAANERSLHGNVPIGESEQMFTALKLLGRPVELVRFPGEDHGLRGTWSNRVLHRTMLLDWFDKWLKDQPRAWESRWE